MGNLVFGETVVYFGCQNNYPIRQPEKLINDISEEAKTIETNLLSCPSVIDFNKNVYKIFSSFDYEISYDGSNIFSDMYDQNFYNEYVKNRGYNRGFISYEDPRIYFVAEEDSLVIETLPPYFHLNNNYIRYICGTFDIGKHTRKLELPVWFSQPSKFTIDKNIPIYYVKFLTTKKIKFKRFYFTNELTKLIDNIMYIRLYNKKSNPLSYYYDLIKSSNFKKIYLKIIKKNLME